MGVVLFELTDQIVIKLPQEWWIHIAQMDTTDVIQERIFGVAAGTPWLETVAARPWVVVIAVIAVGAAIAVAWWLGRRVLPPRDRPLTIDADAGPWLERRGFGTGRRCASSS